MSRHEIPAWNQELSIIVGWDNPLQSFFAQISRKEGGDDDDEDGGMLLWVGTEPREVTTVEDLAGHLAPFGGLSDEMAARLRADRAAMLGQAPTVLQQDLLGLIRRSR